jgi:protein farnesyltransferase subunit beta
MASSFICIFLTVVDLDFYFKFQGGWGKHFDNGQPWMIYWMCNTLGIMGNDIWSYEKDGIQEKAVNYISKCQHPDGGFTGGPYQIGHLASSYAAMLSLVLMGLEDCYKLVNRRM